MKLFELKLLEWIDSRALLIRIEFKLIDVNVQDIILKPFWLLETYKSEPPVNEILFWNLTPLISTMMKFLAEILDAELSDLLLENYPPTIVSVEVPANKIAGELYRAPLNVHSDIVNQ